MDKKTTLHTMLAYLAENCARKECCLNELPVIRGNAEHSDSDWHNTFKYFQDDSRFHNIWKPKATWTEMVETLISHGGKKNAR